MVEENENFKNNGNIETGNIFLIILMVMKVFFFFLTPQDQTSKLLNVEFEISEDFNDITKFLTKYYYKMLLQNIL